MTATRHLAFFEELGMFDARVYGPALASRTLLRSLAEIGARRSILALLPYPNWTQWTLNEPVTIPAHVALYVGPTVTVVGAASLTVYGALLTWHRDWHQGTGDVTLHGGWMCFS